jgi:tripartite-type tricarboxylate transporter receptor subunit TctC
MKPRACFFNLIGGCLSLLALAAPAADYPSHPVRIVLPFPAGGASDFIARLYGEKLTTAFGQQMLIDNRPGAAGVIAAGIVSKANADGYTFLQAFVSHTINPSIYLDLPFDTEKDFAAVALVASSANVVVVPPALPVKSIKEFIDYAKARPGQVNYGSSGLGSNSHLSAEMLSTIAGIKMVHVPYKGGPQANADVIAGTIQVHIPSMPAAYPLIQAGRLKPIAVTSLKRAAVLPDIPAVAETLPGFESLSWDGLLAPRGTPPEAIARFSAEVERALKMPEVVKALLNVGAPPDYKGPKEFDAFIKSEIVRWRKAAQDAGVKPGTL